MRLPFQRRILPSSAFARSARLRSPRFLCSSMSSSSFPTSALLPKEETLAAAFISKFPDCDGRRAVVAILDTGVDPGAVGLQTTTDGLPKIIDIIDATGSGDIDTSRVVPLVAATSETEAPQLQLPDGRTLRLNPEWPASADGTYHVGALAAYDLFPQPLVARLTKERREKFDVAQREARNAVQQELARWAATHAATTSDAAALRAKKDMQARAAALQELENAYRDAGPLYDAVVFFDGSRWRAALDTSETGDFAGVAALTNFRDERQYATFSEASQFNYALNIYDEGQTLSVVCDAGAHGTHVAGIVAAHHPEQPECNGVAPGAQLIAVKIGDSRLGSMETTPALSRALVAMIAARCDVINMSYGEYASEHNTGRVVELLRELVDEHKITFVCSAGNNGPALGTIGAPGGTSSPALGVGAYVSPRMMDAEYVMRRSDLADISYTWSSRGPTFDGDLGVNVCAPGAAITSVPNWTLNKKQLMNGTSMSSPNCAGNIALLVSALKKQGIAYTPYSIRRALEHTAKPLGRGGANHDVFAQGKGVIQVLPAFEYMAAHGNAFDGTNAFPLYYDVAAACGNATNGSARGIFLRDASDFVHDCQEINVTVTPVFHKKAAPSDKVQFEQHLRLVPSARWVEVGGNVALMHQGRAFKVLVDTTHLAAGQMHYAEIVAYDAHNAERGAVLTIPVTVIKPEAVEATPTHAPVLADKLALGPGAIARRFVTPPAGATWADILLTRTTGHEDPDSNAAGKLYMLHVMQFESFVKQSASSFSKAFFLRPGEEVCHSMDLVGGLTAEFCLAQFWSALGDSSVHMQVRFHGVVPDQRSIQYSGGEGAHKLTVRNDLQKEVVAPQLNFSTWTQRVRPTSAEIQPLSASRGDTLPDQRQIYGLVLSYPITMKEAGKVTPRLPLLFGRLYESPFESQLSMIFDEKTKQYMGTSDAYGETISLPKGSYVVRTQVRHEDVSKLEKLKSMVLFLDHALGKEISASVYSHQDDAALARKPLTEKPLATGKHLTMFLGEPASDKLPAGHAPGDMLSGKMYLGKKNGGVQGAGRRPSGFDVSYVIPPAAIPVKEPEPEAPKNKDGNEDELEQKEAQDAVRDLLLARLIKLSGKTALFPAAYERLVAQFPDHVPIAQAQLHHFDAEKERVSQLPRVIEAADAVLTRISEDDLARFFGTRTVVATEGEALHLQKKEQKEKETTRDILIDALARKARALGDHEQWDAFLTAYEALQKWVDVDAITGTAAPVVLQVALLHDKHRETPGLALQRLRKVAALEDAAEKDKLLPRDQLTAKLQTAYTNLQWAHWARNEQQWNRAKSPANFRKF